MVFVLGIVAILALMTIPIYIERNVQQQVKEGVEFAAFMQRNVSAAYALTGSADVDSWWPSILGPGRALDPNRNFIVAINALGSCYGTTGPASLREPGGEPWGALCGDRGAQFGSAGLDGQPIDLRHQRGRSAGTARVGKDVAVNHAQFGDDPIHDLTTVLPVRSTKSRAGMPAPAPPPTGASHSRSPSVSLCYHLPHI